MNHQKSEALFAKACRYIPGGVNSPVRAFANVKEIPLFVDHADGAYLYDVDGNAYLDFICSWGPMILGHNHPLLVNGMEEVMCKGISYGLCTPDEEHLAKLICDAYRGMDMVRMVNSGTEATMSAIRVARGYTKRNKIIKFEGCYHGHSDCLLVKSGSGALTFGTPTSPGVPEDMVKHTLVCRYNDLASVKEVMEQYPDDIAAVIIEPVAGNMGVVGANASFLEGLRALCDEYHSVLIIDEVITGFRLAYGGAAQYYGITPDMACFGKIIGAGLPVGAYGGKKEIMSCVSPCGPIYQAGTLSGNPLAMHLGTLLLDYLKTHPHLYTELADKGHYLKTGIEKLLQEKGLPFQVHQCGSLLTLFFTDTAISSYDEVKTCSQDMFTTYFHTLYEEGILLAPSPYEAMFLSDAHTKEQLDYVLDKIALALDKVKRL